ncbi:MAG: hypothetical protein GY867_09310 [bacterium]|nr:hypothetical protein [bacterium]
MSNAIEQYLNQLKHEMAGCDPATVQDALSDAEIHLNSAFESARKAQPETAEALLLQGVIEKYGSPEEVASAYRDIEARVVPTLARSSEPDIRPLSSRFLAVTYDPRAWGSLLYLLLAMPLGIVYFTWAATGLYLSVGLAVLIIGILFFGFFLLSVRGIALVEGRIVEALLGIRMPRRPIFSDHSLSWWERLKVLVKERTTWTSLLYMLLMMPLGMIYFTVVIFGFALSISCIGRPILQYAFDRPFLEVEHWNWYWSDGMMPLVVIAGFVIWILVLHLAKLLGRLHGSMAKAMLVKSR